jgi:hypothetical protein
VHGSELRARRLASSRGLLLPSYTIFFSRTGEPFLVVTHTDAGSMTGCAIMLAKDSWFATV